MENMCFHPVCMVVDMEPDRLFRNKAMAGKDRIVVDTGHTLEGMVNTGRTSVDILLRKANRNNRTNYDYNLPSKIRSSRRELLQQFVRVES
jgi:hypothetical protein